MTKTDSTNIARLKHFMRRYNMPQSRAAPRRITDADWQRLGSEVITATYTQYFDNDNAFRGIRPSNAYKPAIVHVLNKFGYGLSPEVIKWNRAYAPFIGNITEALMLMLLTECGVEYTRGTSLPVLGGAMHGTPDLIVDGAVVDIKSMNGYYFRQFFEQPNDDRGYVTQLHLYAQALGVYEMYVLAFCKDYAAARLIPVSYTEECLDSVKRRLDVLNSATDVTAIRNCPIPPLTTKRNELLVMPQLQYDGCKSLLYRLTDEDDEFCKTATGVRTHDEILSMLLNVEPPVNDALLFDDSDTDDLPY